MNEPKAKKIIISVSEKKNLQEVVYHNVGPDGKKASLTRHEPLCPGKVYKRREGREVQAEAKERS